jgi:5-methyltetrahydropteroyltriglutamate--homocysteine methyltransferase
MIGPPFRAEHIGSLLRPQALKAAWRQRAAGEIDDAGYHRVLDVAVLGAVRMQEEVGLKAITDGELRRASYWSHFVEAVDGLGIAPSLYRFRDADGNETAFTAPNVEGPLRWTRPVSGAAFDVLRDATRRTPKVTLPSPPTMHFWRGPETFSGGAYTDEEAYFADLAAVYRAEIADLAARGARYIQLDEVPLAMLCDGRVRARIAESGEDPGRLAQRYVALINACIRDAPADMRVGLHLCRGNFKARWLSEGGYDDVAELLFNGCAATAFFLEYDTARAGGFAPLRHLPKDKIAVLGLITTKSPELEDADTLRRRIDEAARNAPLDNLALSPQCGFSSTVAGNPLSEDDQRRKLALVVAVAESVWGGG